MGSEKAEDKIRRKNVLKGGGGCYKKINSKEVERKGGNNDLEMGHDGNKV